MKKLSLSSIAEVYNGKTPSKAEQRNKGAPVLKIKDVNETGVFRGAFDSFVDPELAKKFAHKKVELGDILILNAAHNADYVGSKIYRAQKEVVGALPTGEWLVIRGNPEKVNDAYLFHWVKSPRTRFHIRKLVKGIHLYPKDVKELEIDIPSLSEQKRIAAILDKADAIRRKREKAMELTDSFLRSVFLEMFGDPAVNPKGWEVIELASVFSTDRAGTTCGPFGSSLKKQEYVDAGIPVWGIDNVSPNQFVEAGSLFITPDKFVQLKRYNAIDGDILISRAGTVGRMCVCHPSVSESVIGTNLIRLSLNKKRMLPYYFTSLYTFFAARLPGLRSSSDPDAYSFLNTTKLSELKIPCPPIELQQDYERLLFKVRNTQAKFCEANATADRLKQSLANQFLKQEKKPSGNMSAPQHQEVYAL